jgi:hypothetical protein
VAQVPGAVADVQLRVEQVVGLPLVAPGAVGDPLTRLRQQLHQPDRAGRRPRIRVELRLLVDHGGHELGIQVVVLRVTDDDLLVAERVAQPLVPARLGLEDVKGERREHEPEHAHCGQPHPVNSFITPATQASRSSSVPVFT